MRIFSKCPSLKIWSSKASFRLKLRVEVAVIGAGMSRSKNTYMRQTANTVFNFKLEILAHISSCSARLST